MQFERVHTILIMIESNAPYSEDLEIHPEGVLNTITKGISTCFGMIAMLFTIILSVFYL